MGEFASIFNTWLANRRIRQTIRNIEKNNELRKNITLYEPSDIEGFIERDSRVGSYIISGGLQSYRARTAASVVACSLSQGVPVVVLHEGDRELENSIAVATAFTNNKVIIKHSTSVYDPFYNRSNQEICNLIMNSVRTPGDIGTLGQQYISGISDFIRSKNIPPYCEMLVRCPHDELIEKIDDAENLGYLTSQKAAQIRGLIMQGQSERANVQAFFSQLSYQATGVLLSHGSRSHAVNIRTAVEHAGLLMIDIGSSTNDLLVNLLVNEIKDMLSSGKKLMLVIDGIAINSNVLLSNVVKSLSARCLTCILAEDVYSVLGADDNVFHSFVGNACKCVVYAHSVGLTCNKWSEVFGYYDVDRVSHNMGSNQNYQWGYGFGSQNSINVSTNREFIVKPEEINQMASNEVYILDRNAKELAFTTIR